MQKESFVLFAVSNDFVFVPTKHGNRCARKILKITSRVVTKRALFFIRTIYPSSKYSFF